MGKPLKGTGNKLRSKDGVTDRDRVMTRLKCSGCKRQKEQSKDQHSCS